MQKPKIELHNVDCLPFMRGCADKQFDLAIVDPPYGLERFKAKDGGNSKKIRSFGDKDKNWNNIKPLDEYWQELFRISTYQIVWGANNFELPPSEYFIIWDKEQKMPSFAQCEQAWTNIRIPAKIYRKRSIDPDRIHPTQKPVDLYKWLLDTYAKPNYKILDTHLGSGSVGIACWDMGFDLTACEIDTEYFEKASKRIDFHKRQLTLF